MISSLPADLHELHTSETLNPAGDGWQTNGSTNVDNWKIKKTVEKRNE